MCKSRAICKQPLCAMSLEGKEWWVSVHCYFYVRKGLASFYLNRHLWVSHNQICGS